MRHSALNVYFHGQPEQNRLLAECLGPALRELWSEGALGRLWLHRYDARGPHVMALLGAPADRAGEAQARLAARLDAYLAASPSTVEMPAEALEQRHAECRGAQLCAADALPGIAPNNSYAFAEHPADGYLFRLAAGMDAGEVDRLLGELSLWSVGRLGGSTAVAAARWVADFGVALARAGMDPGGVWRYYAASLLPGLGERIEAEDPEVVEGLPRLVGERNLAAFARLWDAAEAGPPLWPGTERLAEVVAAGDVPTPRHRVAFARELTHNVLAQLDQLVKARIPLVLYAWLRTLPQPAAA